MDKVYIKASIEVNDHYIYIETTTSLINKLFDHFMDNGYSIEKLSENTYYDALRMGIPVYQAVTVEIVDEFIENNNKAKAIKNGDKESKL